MGKFTSSLRSHPLLPAGVLSVFVLVDRLAVM